MQSYRNSSTWCGRGRTLPLLQSQSTLFDIHRLFSPVGAPQYFLILSSARVFASVFSPSYSTPHTHLLPDNSLPSRIGRQRRLFASTPSLYHFFLRRTLFVPCLFRMHISLTSLSVLIFSIGKHPVFHLLTASH